ncbi:MAG: peptidase M15 [Prevotella sp.]|nr:peptidase M15 [Prevotella sp.]
MQHDKRLSEHFMLSEFTRSETARRLGIGNEPNVEQTENLRNLCTEILEPLRRAFGPIYINSGYRSARLNEAVRGVGNSCHLRGEAADIRIPDLQTGVKYYQFLRDHTNFDQLLFEYNRRDSVWIHVSCKQEIALNRHQAFPNYATD